MAGATISDPGPRIAKKKPTASSAYTVIGADIWITDSASTLYEGESRALKHRTAIQPIMDCYLFSLRIPWDVNTGKPTSRHVTMLDAYRAGKMYGSDSIDTYVAFIEKNLASENSDYAASVLYDTYLPFTVIRPDIGKADSKGETKHGGVTADGFHWYQLSYVIARPLVPVMHATIPHYADVISEVMFAKTPTTSRPVHHILWKLFPRASNSRRFAPILQQNMDKDPVFKMEMTEIMLCSLLGNYPHCRQDSRPDRNMRLCLYATFMPRTFQYYDGVGPKQRVHIRNMFHNSSVSLLGLFLLREYLVFLVDSEPALREQANALFDYDAVYREAVLRATAEIRIYVRDQLQDTSLGAGGGWMQGTMTEDRIAEQLYVNDMEARLLRGYELIVEKGAYRKQPDPPLELIRSAKGRITPTLDWARQLNVPVHYCAEPTSDEKGTETRHKTRARFQRRKEHRIKQDTAAVVAAAGGHTGDDIKVKIEPGVKRRADGEYGGGDEDGEGGGGAKDGFSDYAASLETKRRNRNKRVRIASRRSVFEHSRDDGSGAIAEYDSGAPAMTGKAAAVRTATRLLTACMGGIGPTAPGAAIAAADTTATSNPLLPLPGARGGNSSSSGEDPATRPIWSVRGINEVPLKGSYPVTRDCVLASGWKKLRDYISACDSSLDPVAAFEAVLRYLPVLGASRVAVDEFRNLVLGQYEMLWTLRDWDRRTRALRAQYCYTYNLLQAAATLWHTHTNIRRRQLPRHFLVYQLRAIAGRYGIPIERRYGEAAATEDQVPRHVPLGATRFVYCDVCNKIYSVVRQRPVHIRQVGKKAKPLPVYGIRDANNDLSNYTALPVSYCNKDRYIGTRKCGDEPLVAVDILGQELIYKGKSYMICGQPGCGFIAVLEEGGVTFNSFGLACYLCTEKINSSHVNVPLVSRIICKRLAKVKCPRFVRQGALLSHAADLAKKKKKKPRKKKDTGVAKLKSQSDFPNLRDIMDEADDDEDGGEGENSDTESKLERVAEEGEEEEEDPVDSIDSIKPTCFLCSSPISKASSLWLYGTNTFTCGSHSIESMAEFTRNYVAKHGYDLVIQFDPAAEMVYRQGLLEFQKQATESGIQLLKRKVYRQRGTRVTVENVAYIDND